MRKRAMVLFSAGGNSEQSAPMMQTATAIVPHTIYVITFLWRKIAEKHEAAYDSRSDCVPASRNTLRVTKFHTITMAVTTIFAMR